MSAADSLFGILGTLEKVEMPEHEEGPRPAAALLLWSLLLLVPVAVFCYYWIAGFLDILMTKIGLGPRNSMPLISRKSFKGFTFLIRYNLYSLLPSVKGLEGIRVE